MSNNINELYNDLKERIRLIECKLELYNKELN